MIENDIDFQEDVLKKVEESRTDDFKKEFGDCFCCSQTLVAAWKLMALDVLSSTIEPEYALRNIDELINEIVDSPSQIDNGYIRLAFTYEK